MSEHATVKNICAEMIHEKERERQTIGCQTGLGCFKGREIENIIKGPLASKLNDLRSNQEVIVEEQEKLRRQQEETLKVAEKAAELVESGHRIIKEQKESNETFMKNQALSFDKFQKGVWWELIKVVLVFIILQAGLGYFTVKANEAVAQKNAQANIDTQNTNQIRLENKLDALITGLKTAAEAGTLENTPKGGK